jgi:hypothetical protein
MGSRNFLLSSSLKGFTGTSSALEGFYVEASGEKVFCFIGVTSFCFFIGEA